MSDQTTEFRVVDDVGDVWDVCGSREDALIEVLTLTRDEPTWAPYRVQSRVVTDWTDLATEAAAESPAAA